MKNRGFYSYKKEDVNVKTLYTIEWTCNRKVYDSMELASFDPNTLNKKEFDFLEDAIVFYIKLFYNNQVLHVNMLEQILVNNEVVLEQFKEPIMPSIVDDVSKKEVETARREMELYKEENEKIKSFLNKYGIDINKIA